MGNTDIIVGPATPKGKGAIGITRLSGVGVDASARKLTNRTLEPRIATLCSFLAADKSAIDQGLAIFFPGPASYTGEDMLELQGHGGVIVQQQLIRRCVELGARLAEPGEFTKRAFLNEKVDLAQAEAVADLIDAQSELAARSAMRSLQGDFSVAVSDLFARLVDLRLLLEASLDFPEEALELVPNETMMSGLEKAREAINQVMRCAQRGSRLREGAKLVLVGRPNVGKSSLMNRLAGDDIALVSEIPGTTRDVLREPIVIHGFPFEVVDTAGLRESQDRLEQMGMARTRRAIGQADVLVYVTDQDGSPDDMNDLPGTESSRVQVLRIRNKIDLTGSQARVESKGGVNTVYVSARTGEGMDLLRISLLERVGWESSGEEGIFLARERHLSALQEASDYLNRASHQVEARELCAEELRLAQRALSRITGEFTSDDLLGEIFGRFCIGK
jgi:tRNA modification GTPase